MLRFLEVLQLELVLTEAELDSGMTQRMFIEARLRMTRQDLDQVLSRLNDELIPFAPHEGMNTVGALLLEIANKDREIVGYLRNHEWPDDEPDPFAEDSSLEEMKAGLDATRQATLRYISELDAEQLDEIVRLPERWWEALRLLECPRSEMLRNIAMHEWYHTGQLVSYLWSRGDDPSTWE